MKSIIVTGGAGFIGSALVGRLVAAGNKVKVIDSLWRGKLENLLDEHGQPVIDLRTDFVQADLCDYHNCLEHIRNAEIVYHLADVVGGIDFVFANESFVFRQNMLINSNVFRACALNGVTKCIYVGTACSYPQHIQNKEGLNTFKEEEAYPANPESGYGWSKLMGEYEATLLAKQGAFKLGLLRLHNVYGPGATCDPRYSQAIPALIRKALIYPEQEFVVWGSGAQYRDFVYIDDVIEGLLSVADKGLDCGAIQLGSGLPTTIRQIAETVVALSGKQISIRYDTSKPEGDFGRVAICAKAQSILQWTPKVSLRTGLEATYKWIETHHTR